MTTRFRDGDVTVTLSGDLERIVRQATEAAAGETLRILEKAAADEAAEARRRWYAKGTGVNRVTGRSGDVEVVTTITEDEIRVSVASTDTERVRDARGRAAPRAAVIRRAGPLSVRPVEITRDEYENIKARGGERARLAIHARKNQKDGGMEAGKYYRLDPNPDASDGAFLVPELIRKPMKARIRVVTPELGRAIAARAGGR